ncbi:MAG: hypothetical protein JW717_11875, partial [Marinilabiliaceae bacterium]|nr:hypothetical protein [Marinilabiliaceae bacterium]
IETNKNKRFKQNSNPLAKKVNVCGIGGIVHNDTTTFYFNGSIDNGNYYSTDDMLMKLLVPNFKPQDCFDLVQLNDSIIDLKMTDCIVEIKIDNSFIDSKMLKGQFYFKKAQILFVDKEKVKSIISGYFDFQILVDDEPMSVSNGRFDLGIDGSNFFVY